MSRQLYIGDYQIELSDKSNIGVTYQANTLSDLSIRQGVFSNEFFAPDTRNNRVALEFSNDINSNTRLPYRKNEVRYFENGVQIICDGFAIVSSFEKGFSLAIYSGNCEIFDLMGEKMLNDLDLSFMDHAYTLANEIASYPNTEFYIYPSVGFNKVGVTTPLGNPRVPFVFIKTLMQKIGEQAGYTLVGNLMDDLYYQNLIQSTVFKHDQDWQQDKNSSTVSIEDHVIDTIIDIEDDIESIYSLGLPNSGHIFGGVYTAPEALGGTFSCTVPIRFTNAYPVSAAIQIVNITTATILAEDEVSDFIDYEVDGAVELTFSCTTLNQNLADGDQVQIRLSVHYTDIGHYTHTIRIGSVFSANINNAFIPHLGSIINFETIQPALKQKDFFKAVLNAFCVVPQPNLATKVLKLNLLNTVGSYEFGIPNAIKWSEKVDKKQPLTITYRDDNFALKNTFKYSNDEEVINEIKKYYFYETDGDFEIDDENLQDEKNIITLPWSGTIRSNIPYRNEDYTIDNFTPRVMYLERFKRTSSGVVTLYPWQTVASFTSQGGANESLSFKKFVGAYSNMDSLLYYYYQIKSILTDYKKINCFVKLNAVDIQKLDFTVPVFLNFTHNNGAHVNGYFYLNLVSNYKDSENLTQCEFIRL